MAIVGSFRPSIFECRELGSKRELSILEQAAASVESMPVNPAILKNFENTGYNLVGISNESSHTVAWVMANPQCRPFVKVLIKDPNGYNATGRPFSLTPETFTAIANSGVMNDETLIYLGNSQSKH